jgi:hypothetical protein
MTAETPDRRSKARRPGPGHPPATRRRAPPAPRDPAGAARPGPTRGFWPSSCRYQCGPWPVPHDRLVDFRSTLAGFEWLDALGQRAVDQILNNLIPCRGGSRRLVRGEHRGPRRPVGRNLRLAARRRHRSGHGRLRGLVPRRQPDRWWRLVDPERGRCLPTRLRGGTGPAFLQARTANGCRRSRLDPRLQPPLANRVDRPRPQ